MKKTKELKGIERADMNVTITSHNLIARNGISPIWLIPKLKISGKGGGLFYGPQSSFQYMTFGEFVILDTYFIDYHRTGDEKTLDKLCATLYRPRVKSDSPDVRALVDTATIPARAALWAGIEFDTKYIIQSNYMLVRNHLGRKYPYIFEGGSQKKGETTGWLSIRDSLAPAIIDLPQVDKTLLSDALRRLNENAKKAKDEQ